MFEKSGEPPADSLTFAGFKALDQLGDFLSLPPRPVPK